MKHLTWLLALVAMLLPGSAMASEDYRVAVLYFENQGNPELEPLKVGLAQMLITDLQGTPGVTVVERAELQAILEELELGHSGKVDPETAARVGKLLGASHMVLGSYFEMMGTLRMDARLVKVETGEIVHAHGVNGEAKAFMDLEKQLAENFEAKLTETAGVTPPASGGGELPAATASAPRELSGGTLAPEGEEILEPDADAIAAALAFSEGLIYLDNKDAPRARESFEKALAEDPSLEHAKTQLASLDL